MQRDLEHKHITLRTFLEAHQIRSPDYAQQLLEEVPETATDDEFAGVLAEEFESAHARILLQEHVGALRDLYERFLSARTKVETQITRYWAFRTALYRAGVRDP